MPPFVEMDMQERCASVWEVSALSEHHLASGAVGWMKKNEAGSEKFQKEKLGIMIEQKG